MPPLSYRSQHLLECDDNRRPKAMAQNLTAILLCGGRGERLHPFTETVPKPLVDLNGKPILYHLMHYLAWQGIDDFVLCTGYKAEMIEAFIKASAPQETVTHCVDSGEAGMTGRLLHARKHANNGRFLICYGDTLANVDITSLTKDHEESGALVTMTVFPLQCPYGIVNLEEDHVTGFREKPRLPYWINIGFMLCEQGAFDYMRPDDDMPEFLDRLVVGKLLGAHRHEGKHLTVNTPKDLKEAEIEIRDFYTLQCER